MYDSIVLNEASLPFGSEDECKENLASFFEMLHRTKLSNVQFSRADGIEGDWNSLVYAENFQFGQWLNNIDDRDQIRQIQSVLSSIKCPVTTQHSDYLFHLASDTNVDVEGLGYASLNNSHGLSFPSQAHWKANSIKINKLWYVNDVEHSNKIDVPNICTLSHMELFLVGLEKEQQANRDYFKNIETENNIDFPNLIFSHTVLKTLRSSTLSAIDQRYAIRALKQLDSAIALSNNITELATNANLRISGESAPTMDNNKLKRLRRFKHPTLGNQIFEDHVKNFPNSKRMHIISDYINNTVCIGYFGNHLKTSSE
ncbi:hypothetical protein CWO01_02890 [Vibrio splendidus]|uniref:hypothetical protein n=1 Tax=Vibrio splendidus TaxID=29497 RepID=UPI000C82AB08|nr:hypothetical protein [Vibrio splendidus]PMO41965.1 hypothetical protein BCT09_21170 [Vibrio splendidus]PTP64878.1 hypothetical protein CWO01_02890 [Vibrio splendidus]